MCALKPMQKIHVIKWLSYIEPAIYRLKSSDYFSQYEDLLFSFILCAFYLLVPFTGVPYVGRSVFLLFFQGKFRFSKWCFPGKCFPENSGGFFTICQAVSVFSIFTSKFPFFSVLNKVFFTVFSRKFLFFRIFESRTEYLVKHLYNYKQQISERA